MAKPISSPKPIEENPNPYSRYLPHFVLIVLAFVLYCNTLFYGYVLDDAIVIKDNAFTKKGFDGLADIFKYDSFTGFFGVQKTLVAGGRYRPFSIATFAIEYQLFGGFNPFVSRLINILLYGFTGVMLMVIFSRLLATKADKKWLLSIPFLTAILFIVHPIHTEVVANIKGRDEIFSLLFSLLSLWCALLYLDRKKFYYIALSGFWFFIGILSKENAIMFLFIIPLTVYFFTKQPLKKVFSIAAILLIPALLFIFIRYKVLGYMNSPELPKELLNNPFLFATFGQKIGTVLYTLGLYVKLLFFPFPLTHDYYPYHIPLVDLLDLKSVIPFILYAAMGFYALIKIRKKELVSFGIIFYLSTLFIVSNLLFSVGTFMNERFVYMPSVGFVLVLAFIITTVLPKYIKSEKVRPMVLNGLILLILVPFGIKTFARNFAWEDDFSLFTTDVKISENSLKCTTSAGGKYLEKAQADQDPIEKEKDFQLALKYLNKATSIYPYNNNSLILLGNALVFYKADYKGAIDQYLKVLSFDPYDKNAYSNLFKVITMLEDAKEVDYKMGVLHGINKINPENADANYFLGKLYGQYKGNLDSAEFFLVRATKLSPENPLPYKDLGIVYGMRKNYGAALQSFQTALKLDPKDAQVQQNIEITNHLIGQ